MGQAPSNEAPASGLSVRRNLGYASLARVVQALAQFAAIACVARIGGADTLGALTLSAAVVVPLFFLTSLGMRDVHTVDDLSRFGNADYVALRILGGSVAMILAGLIAALAYGAQGIEMQATILAFALVRFFWSQAGLAHAMFQRAERLDLVALSIIVRCLFGFAVFLSVFWVTRSLVPALAAEALSAFCVYLLLDRRLLARIGIRVTLADFAGVRLRQLASLMLWTLPLGLAMWFGRSTVSAPPVVLEREAGLAAVGLFGALAYAHTGLSTLATGFQNATAARLRRHFRANEQRAFWRLTARLLALLGALGLVALALAWTLGTPVLTLVYGAEYADRNLLSVIVAASALGLLSTPLTTVISSAHAFRVRLAVAVPAFVAAALAALLLVPAYGAMGAGWALMAGLGTQLLAAILACWLLFRGTAGPGAP